MGKHTATNPPSNLVGVTPTKPKYAVPGFVMCRNCGGILDNVIRPWRHLASGAITCNDLMAEAHEKAVGDGEIHD